MFDPQAAFNSFLDLEQHHKLLLGEHIIAGASSTVAGLCIAQRFLRMFQEWAKQWFPSSPLIASAGRIEYGVEAATDFVEIFALNWRKWLVPPPPREVWNDSKRQEQLGEAPKADAAGAGK